MPLWRGLGVPFFSDSSFILFKNLQSVERELIKMGRDSSPLGIQLLDAKMVQFTTFILLNSNPLDSTLILNAKEVSRRCHKIPLMEHSWASKKSKSHCISYSNDDLKFLYSLIKEWKMLKWLGNFTLPLGFYLIHPHLLKNYFPINLTSSTMLILSMLISIFL